MDAGSVTDMMVRHLANQHRMRPEQIADELGLSLGIVLSIVDPTHVEATKSNLQKTMEDYAAERQARVDARLERGDLPLDLVSRVRLGATNIDGRTIAQRKSEAEASRDAQTERGPGGEPGV